MDKQEHHDEVQREASEAAMLVFFLLLVLGTVLVFVVLTLWPTIQSFLPPQTDIRRSEERLGIRHRALVLRTKLFGLGPTGFNPFRTKRALPAGIVGPALSAPLFYPQLMRLRSSKRLNLRSREYSPGRAAS